MLFYLLNHKIMNLDRPKIKENMWCYHCETEWQTDDYFNCKSCPSCTTEPTVIMRTSSFGFIYAHQSKHPELYSNMFNKDKNVDECDASEA